MKKRHITAIIFGCILFYRIWAVIYHFTVIDMFLFLGLAVFGFIYFLYVFSTDISRYRQLKSYKSFKDTFVLVDCLLPSLIIGIKIHHDFEKASLLKAWYKVDLTAVSVDFKKDGSYVFSNDYFLGSSYEYGKYTISGDTITLDKAGTVMQYKKLVLKQMEFEYKTGPQKELYLMALDSTASNGLHQDLYRVLEDNRK